MLITSTTWKNGVVHREDDVYLVPTETPGVAARVEVTPRLWGLLGSKVEATDCQGEPLDAYKSWNGDLVVRDPRSGLETVIDPDDRTVSVESPMVKHETNSSQHIYREEYFTECRQTVDGEGEMSFRIGLHGRREITTPPAKSGAPPVTLQDDQTWTEVELTPGEEPEAYRLTVDKHGHQSRGADLQAHVSPDGRMELVGEDGVTVSYEMYIRP